MMSTKYRCRACGREAEGHINKVPRCGCTGEDVRMAPITLAELLKGVPGARIATPGEFRASNLDQRGKSE